MIKSNYAIKLDKNIEPVHTCKDGDTIVLESVNAYGEHFSNMGELMDLISGKHGDKHHHPLTGPIDIEGAEEGDVIEIVIKEINIDLSAQALSKSAGISPIEVEYFGDRAPILAKYNNTTKNIKYMNGMHIPYRPMLGMIGLAPAEGFIKTGHAGRTGGNLDIPFITEGVSVYIPVQTSGGKLFVGDAHAAQGYGELGGIALEASAIVTLEIALKKPRYMFNNIVVIGKEPMTNRRAIGIIGVANSFQNLNEAVCDAYKGAVDIMSYMLPTINKNYVSNVVTAIGHSINGQAFSKTSESTSIVNILEDDMKVLKKDSGFTLYSEFNQVMFK